ETDGLGAHTCRRRVLARVSGFAERRGGPIGAGLLVGVATFPHDGHDLAQLLRKARRRADLSKSSLSRMIRPEVGLASLLDAREPAAASADAPVVSPTGARRFELPIAAAAALAASITSDALRGGGAFFAVAHHAKLSLGAALRSVVGQGRD